MIRIYINQPLSSGQIITLEGDQHHYLRNVMRAEVGHKLLVFDGISGEYNALITDISKKNLTLSINELSRQQINEPDIWLCFAPIKSGHLDFVAEKASELGVAVLQPVKTERTVVSRVNTERLERIAIEAAEQCERMNVPIVKEIKSLKEIVLEWDASRQLIVCDETGGGRSASEVFPKLMNEKAAILIGPEGGFAPAELELIRNQPYVTPVSLGSRILRADTAAIAALTLWQAFKGDWNLTPSFPRRRESNTKK